MFILPAQNQARWPSHWRAHKDKKKKHNTRRTSKAQINVAANSGHTSHRMYYKVSTFNLAPQVLAKNGGVRENYQARGCDSIKLNSCARHW